jgi:hypothetical protein
MGEERHLENVIVDTEAPPLPPELPLEWAYLENGAVQDRGAADCVIEGKRLYYKCKSGPPFDVQYSEIAAIEDRGVNLLLTMRDGSAMELSQMARMRDMLRAALMDKWTALNRKQALAEETLLANFTGKARQGGGEPLPAGIGIYETAIVFDFENGLVSRIPLIFSGRPEELNYAFVFSPPGESWTVSHLGRDTDRFRLILGQAFNGLEEKAQQRIRALCPKMPPFKLRLLVGKFLDGLAVPLKAVRAAWPALEQAMVGELAQAGLEESWKAAAELGDGASARIGQKAALKSSDGLYRWFFVPVIRGDKAAIIMEASSEGSSGRATYVFRVPGGPQAAEQAMDSLNYGLVMINFRREPIYMSDEQMQKPGNEHYLRSVERVPALASLRLNFIGRAAHTTSEAWQKALQGLLASL